MMKKIVGSATALLLVLVILGFFIPVKLTAPPDVRTIVDHTQGIYVTPPCFDEAELTNYLQETTLSHAQELDYKPDSSCTTASLTEEGVPINMAILKIVGLQETKWDDSSIWQ